MAAILLDLPGNLPGTYVEDGTVALNASQIKTLQSGALADTRCLYLIAWRSVIRVNSDGRPSRSAKPGHSAVPLFT
jgi:hypothetical protein